MSVEVLVRQEAMQPFMPPSGLRVDVIPTPARNDAVRLADKRPAVSAGKTTPEAPRPTDFNGPARYLRGLVEQVHTRMREGTPHDAAVADTFTTHASPALGEFGRLIRDSAKLVAEGTSADHALTLATRQRDSQTAISSGHAKYSYIDTTPTPPSAVDRYMVAVVNDVDRQRASRGTDGAVRHVLFANENASMLQVRRLVADAAKHTHGGMTPEAALEEAVRQQKERDSAPVAIPTPTRRTTALPVTEHIVKPTTDALERSALMAKARAGAREERIRNILTRAHRRVQRHETLDATSAEAVAAQIMPSLLAEAIALTQQTSLLEGKVDTNTPDKPITLKKMTPDPLPEGLPVEVVPDDAEHDTAKLVVYKGSNPTDAIQAADRDRGIVVATVPESVARRFYNTDSGVVIASQDIGHSNVLLFRRHAKDVPLTGTVAYNTGNTSSHVA